MNPGYYEVDLMAAWNQKDTINSDSTPPRPILILAAFPSGTADHSSDTTKPKRRYLSAPDQWPIRKTRKTVELLTLERANTIVFAYFGGRA